MGFWKTLRNLAEGLLVVPAIVKGIKNAGKDDTPPKTAPEPDEARRMEHP